MTMNASEVASISVPTLAALVFIGVTAIAASLAAAFTLFSARTTMKASRGNAMINCLNNYILIMSHKSIAIEKRDKRLAEEFYRELFDLHWNEFHLWQDAVIPDNAMRAWLSVRHRNYKSDKITCDIGLGKTRNITYKQEWNKLIRKHYFEEHDPFVTLMNVAHSTRIENLKKLRKETKRCKDIPYT